MKHSDERYANPPFPRDLRGNGRPDPFWVALHRVTPVLERLTRVIGQPRPPERTTTRDRAVVVSRVERPAEGIAALTLEAADGGALPAWQPGCHVDVVLPSGLVRQYSLSGDPADRRRYRIAVRRIPEGAGSGEVHGLAEGTPLLIRGPRNAFPFAAYRRYVFVAGGVGITPILPMVRAAARGGVPFRLVYTGRSRATMPFLDELPAVANGEVVVRPDDEFGVPDPATLVADPPPGTGVYCCGPPPLIEGVRDHLPDVPGTGFHWERFSPPPISDGVPFEVELARTGRVLRVPADRTALETIQRVLPGVAYSCRQGFCGTCRVPLLAGTPDHRDRPTGGGSPMGTTVTICVSRARGGRIVVDL